MIYILKHRAQHLLVWNNALPQIRKPFHKIRLYPHSLTTLRDNLSVYLQGSLNPWTCTETWVRNCHSTLRNASDERRSLLLRGWRLKWRIVWVSFSRNMGYVPVRYNKVEICEKAKWCKLLIYPSAHSVYKVGQWWSTGADRQSFVKSCEWRHNLRATSLYLSAFHGLGRLDGERSAAIALHFSVP
jgi:hypothetical protein